MIIEKYLHKLEDISGKNFEGKTYYRFKLKSKEDIYYFIELFKQIYALEITGNGEELK